MADTDILVSDAEREGAVARLRRACEEGRLTLAEFSERLDAAFAARTRADLVRVTADLAQPAPAPFQGRPVTRRVVALLSSIKQRGRWRASDQIEAVSILAECKIDLTQAEVEAAEIAITATAVMGQVTILVPPGVEVEMDGWSFLGAREHVTEPGFLQKAHRALAGSKAVTVAAPVDSGRLLLRVNTRIVMGEVKVETVP